MKTITLILLVIAIILTGLGGIADYTKREFIISKQHLWNDGKFLLIAAILFEISK